MICIHSAAYLPVRCFLAGMMFMIKDGAAVVNSCQPFLGLCGIEKRALAPRVLAHVLLRFFFCIHLQGLEEAEGAQASSSRHQTKGGVVE